MAHLVPSFSQLTFYPVNYIKMHFLFSSSLCSGLVATIKEHITKPTAMAQGRVAHLIEWKGWGGCGGGCGGMGTELQEDEQFYSQMTDEIKEARFAAGVAEQFALAEAAMNVWSMSDSYEQPSTSSQAAAGHFLSKYLLDGGSVGVPQYLYSIHTQAYGDRAATGLIHPPPVGLMSPTCTTQQDIDVPFEERSTVMAEAAVRHVDSSSLSEDDVFYN
uniref:Family with sequence similarity 131 member C n=1 Tax=Cyprinodon variegatus TaxID=28743 RepID=A0A3Q2D5R2_CYPVA